MHAVAEVERRKCFYKQQGLHYFRPWIFLITDGAPSDDWSAARDRVSEGERTQSFAFFAVGVGDARFDILERLSIRKPLRLQGLRFQEMFLWLSRSLQTVSQSSPMAESTVRFPVPRGWAGL